MKGWLNYTRGGNDPWKRRFSMLNDEAGILSIYKGEVDGVGANPKGLIPLKGARVDMPQASSPGNEFQFCICRIGDILEKAKKPKISSASYSKGFSQSVAKLGNLVRTNSGSTSRRTVVHYFSAENEEVLIQWINAIAHTCAIHIADGDETPVSSPSREESKHEKEDEKSAEPEEDEEFNMRAALKAQRLKEQKERKAATFIQSLWRMKLQQRVYFVMLKEYKAAKLLLACMQMLQCRKAYLPVRKQHRYRVNVQREMVTTEASYIEGLRSLVNVFLVPLREQELINPPQISSIFSNIESILSLHNYLLTELQSRLTGAIPPYETIGGIFTFLLPQFKLYVEYINNYDSAVKLLQKLRESNSKFQKFLTKANEIPELNMKPIESFLIMPVQRLPRIEMLLKDLLKHTDESHPDQVTLERAFEGISEITAFVNERKREAENFQKMAAVQRKMGKKGSGHSIVQPHRKWLKEGTLEVYSKDKKKRIERSVILFSDMLLCSTEKSVVAIKKGLHHTVRYDTLESYQLDRNSQAVSAPDDPTSFIVKTRHATCTLFAESEAEKTQWCNTINETVNQLAKPRAFTASGSRWNL